MLILFKILMKFNLIEILLALDLCDIHQCAENLLLGGHEGSARVYMILIIS